MKLTVERLNLEYVQWSSIHGTGRNEKDLRFGQFIHNKYDLPAKIDVFYIERADKSYNTLLSWLGETQTENIL